MEKQIKKHFKPDLIQSKKKKLVKGKSLQKDKVNAKAAKDQEAFEKDEKIMSRYGALKIIDILISIQSIKNEQINSSLKTTVLELHERIKEFAKKEYEALKPLLNIYGYPDDIIGEYEEKKIKEQLEKQKAQEEAEEQERLKQLQLVDTKSIEKTKQTEETKVKNEVKRGNSNAQRRSESQIVPHVSNESKTKDKLELVPYKPTIDLGQKALIAIEKIKKEKEKREAQVLN